MNKSTSLRFFRRRPGGKTYDATLLSAISSTASARSFKALTFVRYALFILALPALSSCSKDVNLSFLNPQGPIASLQRVHFIEIAAVLTIFVALPILVLIPWFAWRYRFSARSSRYTPRWAACWPLEVLAWSGPVVIVTILATLVWPATHVLDPYRPLASESPPLRLQVIGYDWKWLFIYPDLGVASVGVLRLPAGRPVAIQLTSATVMQSLQIPALGSQIYAMGGMVTQLHLQADKPGRFMGENTMYNGDGFHQQRFTTVAMTPMSFQAWAKDVQAHGAPLDGPTLRQIAKRTTRAQLIAALGQMGDRDGGLYFSHASPDVFQDIVRSTMNGAPVHSRAARQPATSPGTPATADAMSVTAETKP